MNAIRLNVIVTRLWHARALRFQGVLLSCTLQGRTRLNWNVKTNGRTCLLYTFVPWQFQTTRGRRAYLSLFDKQPYR